MSPQGLAAIDESFGVITDTEWPERRADNREEHLTSTTGTEPDVTCDDTAPVASMQGKRRSLRSTQG